MAEAKSISTGTVTFLFTDIEGSTRFWVDHPEEMSRIQVLHDALLKKTVEDHSGYVFKTVGDQTCAVFAEAREALVAAVAAQQALQTEEWSIGAQRLLVRMALHTGSAEYRAGDYFGAALSRVARLESAASGGQILVSLATQELVRDQIPEGLTLRDLGRHRLKDLTTSEQVFQLEAAGLPSQFGPLKTLGAVPNNLPFQSAPLIGRSALVEEAKRWLASTRLLTLTGPGGTGKTSLAVQLAADSLESFPDGVYFVGLGTIADPANVPPMIAAALSVIERPKEELVETICRHLEDIAPLLVLDNFEQVMTAAGVVSRLLERSPRLKVITTSREPLHLHGEQEFPVPPLALPDWERKESIESFLRCEAVELFVQRAQAVNPSFRATVSSLPAIAEICIRLDGLPLAIELAASRMKIFTPVQLLERLDRTLQILAAKGSSSPERHRTLKNTIGWSYDLLDEKQRLLFRRLAVFVDGFTVETAEAICGAAPSGGPDLDVFEGIDSLLNKSLLRQSIGEEAGGMRFWMLQTIREYAIALLDSADDAAEIRCSHARYFASLAETFHAAMYGDTLGGPDENAWLGRISAEHGNIIAALEWSTSGGELEQAFRIVGHLLPYYFNQAHLHEVSFWTDKLVALSQGMDPRLAGRVYRVAGFASLYSGDKETAERRYATAEALARKAGDLEGEGHAITTSALSMSAAPEFKTAIEERLRRAIDLFTKAGNRRMIGMARNNLGEHFRSQGQYQEALAEYEASLALVAGGNSTRLTRVNLGMTRYRIGDKRGAAKAFCRVLEEERRGILSPFTVSDSLAGMAAVAEESERAARLLGASTKIAERAGYTREPVDQVDFDVIRAAIQANQDAETFDRSMAAGAAMSMDEAIAYALDENGSQAVAES